MGNSALDKTIVTDLTDFNAPMTITNAGTTDALLITQNGVLAAGEMALRVHSNTAQTTSQLVQVYQQNASSNQVCIDIANVGSGSGLTVGQTGVLAVNNEALQLYSNAAQTTGNALCNMELASGSSTIPVLKTVNAGTGMCVHVKQDGVCVAQAALYVSSGAAQTTAPLLQVDQASGSSTKEAAGISNTGTGDGLYINQIGVNASGEYGLQVYSNAVQVNGGLVYLRQNNTSSTQGALVINHQGSNAAQNIFANNAGAAHLRLTGDCTNSSPDDGDLWYTGTALNFNDGSTTTDLLAGGGGAYELVQSATFTNSSNVQITQTIAAGDVYRIIWDFTTGALNFQPGLRVNNNSASNYQYRRQGWEENSGFADLTDNTHLSSFDTKVELYPDNGQWDWWKVEATITAKTSVTQFEIVTNGGDVASQFLMHTECYGFFAGGTPTSIQVQDIDGGASNAMTGRYYVLKLNQS